MRGGMDGMDMMDMMDGMDGMDTYPSARHGSYRSICHW